MPADHELATRLRRAGCVFAEEEAAHLLEAAAGDPARLEELTARREAGEPLEYVVGWVGFDGHRIAIGPGVFIPRQRTTLLVDLAAARVRPSGTLVDLGCGTGALGIAVAHRRPGLHLHAVDIDPAAVACARRNLAEGRHAVVAASARVHLGDLTAPLPADLTGRVDVVVANMPYVPTAARALMPAESRHHEPGITTDGGPDGLSLVRRAAAAVVPLLRPGGALVVEAGGERTGQDVAAADALRSAGLAASIHRDDERCATAVVGVRAHGGPRCDGSDRTATTGT